MNKNFVLTALTPLLIGGALCISTFTTAAESYRMLAVGASQHNYLTDTEQLTFISDWSPTIAAGIGYRVELNANWQLESELSIEYSQVQFSAQDVHTVTASQGQVDALGLWASSRLIRKDWFDKVSPFLELGIGGVRLDYQTTHVSTHDQVNSYRLAAGLQFELANRMSLSLAVGTSNTDAITGL
jgi:opacity protein-like surface antigen